MRFALTWYRRYQWLGTGDAKHRHVQRAMGECFVSSMTVPACLGFGVLCALGVNGTAAYSDLCIGCWKEEKGTIEGFR